MNTTKLSNKRATPLATTSGSKWPRFSAVTFGNMWPRFSAVTFGNFSTPLAQDAVRRRPNISRASEASYAPNLEPPTDTLPVEKGEVQFTRIPRFKKIIKIIVGELSFFFVLFWGVLFGKIA